MTTYDLTAASVPATARRRYRVPVLGFVLELAPMTQANEGLWRAALKAASSRAAGIVSDELTPESVAAGRRRDATLMAAHVLVGWDGVTNAAGQPVAFSEEEAEGFLLALATTAGAGHLFDGIRAFASDPANFTGAALASAQALAGNSSGA